MKRKRYHKANEIGWKKRRRSSFVLDGIFGKNKARAPAKAFYISRKRSEGDFVLVRILGAAHLGVIRFLAIEGQILQLELRVLKNKWELEILQRDCKLRWEGLFVELEAVSYQEYISFERIALRQLFNKLTLRS